MTRLFALFVLLLTLAGASLAAPPRSAVGKWTGKLHVKFSAAVLAQMPPDKQKTSAAQIASVKFTLTVSKGGTYTIQVLGPTSQTSTGKWSQKGNKVTLTSDKAPAAAKNQTATMAANGKTMTLPLPANTSMSGSITFTRI